MIKMRFIKMSVLLGGLAFMAACTSAPESDDAQVGDVKDVKEVDDATSYTADLSSSNVEWIGTKNTGWHHGVVNLESGGLKVKDGEIVGGEFVMDMSTIQAQDEKMNEEMNAKLTGHLKSPDFFEVGNHPTAKFVLSGVEPTAETVDDEITERTKEIEKYKVTNPTHTVSGNLTVKGITKGVSFPAKITMTGDQVEAIAKFNINRRDWQLNWDYPEGEAMMNDIIHLGIKLVASEQMQASN